MIALYLYSQPFEKIFEIVLRFFHHKQHYQRVLLDREY
jgi:hypothetical protein